MKPDFSFIGFTPHEETKRKAFLTVERFLNLAPIGSMVFALLQKDEVSYLCVIEIYSKHGLLIASASDSDPDAALECVAKLLTKKLDRWKKLRSFSESEKPFQSMTTGS